MEPNDSVKANTEYAKATKDLDAVRSAKARQRTRIDSKTNRERMLGAKAQADMIRQKKQLDKADEIFADAESVDQVLSYLAGGASLCWDKRPTGVFQPEMATALVDSAGKRLGQLMRSSLEQTIAAAKEQHNGE